MRRRLALVGTGLIGGSVGLALRGREAAWEVVGYDCDPAAAEQARAVGALDLIAGSLHDAVSGATAVLIAVPIEETMAVVESLPGMGILQEGTTVTDVASTKVEVVERGEKALGGDFVGGHPMAGSERRGAEAAAADLFEDQSWILTPTEHTSSDAYRLVSEIVASLGARVVALAPPAHDALVARLSHIPQLTASLLVDLAARGAESDSRLSLAAGGFRDVTRIAASDPTLWTGIIRSNREAVLEGIDGLRRAWGELAELIEEGRWDRLEAFFRRTQKARLDVFVKPSFTGEPVGLSLWIPDRPGVLAEVTMAAGRLGANIEDLRIVHSTEGGRGRLELVIAGRDAAGALAAALHRLGYRVESDQVD
jgi:prephenate dehydrogenase